MDDKSSRQSTATGQKETASLGRGIVHLSFNQKVTPKSIQQALEQIYRLSGCVGCGLNGIDVRLTLGDPLKEIKQVEGLNGAIMQHY